MRNSARHFDTNYGVPIYQEKISWTPWVWGFLLFMAASLTLAVWAALSTAATIFTAALLLVLIIFASIASKLWITVTKGWLIVGPAAIERAYIQKLTQLNSDETRKLRGVNADPAAFLEIRFWVKNGLQIIIRDPKDKTPYWLISTKNSSGIAKALSAVGTDRV